MARLAGYVTCDQWLAYQVKVANGIEYLVLDELIFVAQAVGVQDTVFVHDDGVVETAATSQAGSTQGLDLAGKAKSTGTRDRFDVRIMCKVDFGKRSEEHTSELQSLMRISYAV